MTNVQRFAVLFLIAIAFIIGSNWQRAGAQAEKEKVQKWEYFTTQLHTKEDLDNLGKEGWELVALEPSMTYYQPNTGAHKTEKTLFFKRPK